LYTTKKWFDVAKGKIFGFDLILIYQIKLDTSDPVYCFSYVGRQEEITIENLISMK
jgi:hypothetical protein